MAAECTMICVDNSFWPKHKSSPSRMRDQATAIEYYYHAKIQANPENTVGIVTTAGKTEFLLFPTNDPREIIWDRVHAISEAGPMNVENTLGMAYNGFEYRDNIKLPRRVILFVGGTLRQTDSFETIGNLFKSKNVALDVFAIGEHQQMSIEMLEALVAAVDNKGNSHIIHVPSASSVCQAILSPPIFPDVRECISRSGCLIMEEETNDESWIVTLVH